MCNPIHPLFGIEKVPYEDKRQKIFAAPSPHIRLSSVKLSCTFEIFYLRSQMLRTARWG